MGNDQDRDAIREGLDTSAIRSAAMIAVADLRVMELDDEEEAAEVLIDFVAVALAQYGRIVSTARRRRVNMWLWGNEDGEGGGDG